MNKSAKQNLLLLIAAGMVFVAANAAIFMGVKSGQIAPADDLFLWGAFAAMSVCSLLWAISLLGLQPMVVAVSYAAGGFLAFYGVRLTPDVNVAEIATSGATYGAFGALVVGNATTKVRLAFFSKQQVPFIAIILGLLLVDGLLNSRISNAGWHVITNAVVFPFLFSGVIVGLIWMMISKTKSPRGKSVSIAESLEEAESTVTPSGATEDAAELLFSVPDGVDGAVAAEHEAASPEIKVEDTRVPMAETAVAPASVGEVTERDEAFSESFFPLDIDEGEDRRIEENPELLGLAAMVAQSAPEPGMGSAPEQTEYRAPEPVVEEVPAQTEYRAPEPVVEAVPAQTEYRAPEPVVEEVPAQTEYRAPEPVVEEVPAQTEYRAPEPVVEEVPAQTEYRAPEPVVEEVPEQTESRASEPVAEGPVASAPERPAVVEEPTSENDIDLKAAEKEKEPDSEEGKAGSENWLNSHLDLLNKLK